MAGRVLVTGASGLIGAHVVRQVVGIGRPVRVVSRRHRPELDEIGVEVHRGDLCDRQSIASAAKGCDVVIHTAGELFDATRMRSTNVEGTANLLASLAAETTHIVTVSSIGVIGPAGKGRVTESHPCHPVSEYEMTKLEAEMLALDFGRRSGIPVAALRPTNVFGERRNGGKDSFAALLAAIASRRFVYFGRSAVANYVYAGDVANACVAAAMQRVQGIFHVNDPSPLESFVTSAASALNVQPPSLHVPKVAAYGLAAVLEAAGRIARRNVPMTINRVRALTNETVYDSERIPGELDWRPRYGYAQGLQRTVEHYRRTGQLP